MDSQSRVFATMLPAAGRESVGNTREQGLEVRAVNRPSNREREVQVTGTAEVWCPADRVSVRVSVGSRKESVNEVINSVSRRLEYILQAVRQHGVGDKDTSVRRFLHREADQYHMDAEASIVLALPVFPPLSGTPEGLCGLENVARASIDIEVVVTFSDFEKMEQVCSVLLEKLDRSVSVGTPHYYHSDECLSQLRRHACVSAVENAQQKAFEISQLLGQTLGHPLLVREEETREQKNEDEEHGGRDQGATPLPHLPCIPTITASSRVSVSFSIRDRSRKKL